MIDVGRLSNWVSPKFCFCLHCILFNHNSGTIHFSKLLKWFPVIESHPCFHSTCRQKYPYLIFHKIYFLRNVVTITFWPDFLKNATLVFAEPFLSPGDFVLDREIVNCVNISSWCLAKAIPKASPSHSSFSCKLHTSLISALQCFLISPLAWTSSAPYNLVYTRVGRAVWLNHVVNAPYQ